MKLVDISGSAISSKQLPACVKLIKELCETIPDDEGWVTRKLGDAIKRRPGTIRHSSCHPALTPYKLVIGCHLIWGNPKTIQKEKRKRNAKR